MDSDEAPKGVGIPAFLPPVTMEVTMQHGPPLLDRITVNPEIFGGKPIIRGMRISVELILSLLAQGEVVEHVLEDYPELELEDIQACLAYAHAAIAHDTLAAVRVAAG